MRKNLKPLAQKLMTVVPLQFKRVFQTGHGDASNLPSTQMQALLSLYQNSPQNMSGLAEGLMISKQQLTKVIDVLVAKKLVRRQEDPSNRRLVLLTLTEEGEKFLQNQIDEKSESLGIFLEQFPVQHQQVLLKAAEIILDSSTQS